MRFVTLQHFRKTIPAYYISSKINSSDSFCGHPPYCPVMQQGLEHNGSMGTSATGSNGKSQKKAKKSSRNDFSDVQRIEMCASAVPCLTTMDLLKNAVDLDDFSKQLDERLTLNPGAAIINGSLETAQEENQGAEEEVEILPNTVEQQPIVRNPMIYTGPAQNQVICVVESERDPEIVPAIVEQQQQQETSSTEDTKIEYREYESELQMPDIIRLIQRDLSEPYSIYTYRYFIHNWPELCFLAMHGSQCVGAIVCKLGMHRQIMKRGYIAMLAVDKEYRKLKIGTNLVQKAIEVSVCEPIPFETPEPNRSVAGNAKGTGRRGCAGNGDHKHARPASVRESRFCAGQTLISLLFERGGRPAVEALVQMRDGCVDDQAGHDRMGVYSGESILRVCEILVSD